MKKYLVTTIFVLIAVQSFANSYYGKHISIDNGLSQASVTAIEYCNNGSLWIGTRFGLNEYRNGQVRAFMGDGYAGLKGSYINGLFSDKYAKLWAMTDKGLYVYDDSSDSFSEVSSNVAFCICERGDTLYIGGNDGIATYSRADGVFTPGKSDVWTDYLKIFEYGSSLLCIDRRLGISLLHDGISENLNIPEIVGATIMAASLYGDILVLSVLGEGVLVYNLALRRTERYVQRADNGFGRDIVLCSEIIDGKVWLGTDGSGILVMDPLTGVVEDFYSSISLNTGTEVPASVTTIYQDPIGNIWIGGVHFGVTGLKATSISTFLPQDTINCFHSSEDGFLYIGTDGNGIYRYSNGRVVAIPSTAGLKITSIADYNRDWLIVCTYLSGFYLVNRHSGRCKPMLIIDRRTTNQESMYGNAPEICSLGDGRMVIFAVNNYLHNPADGSFRLLEDRTDSNAKDLHVIYGEGGSSYAFAKVGIFRLDLESMAVDRIFNARTRGQSINAMVISNGNIIYGTDYGLFSIALDSIANGAVSESTGDAEITEPVALQSGLFTRVTELCAGDDGTIWIGADNALFAYRDGVFELVGENRGVAANEFSASVCQDGVVYLGGSAGFLEIAGADGGNSSDFVEKHFSLHDVSLNGRTVDATGGRVVVPSRHESLAVTVSLFGADPLERMVYKYMVDGASSFTLESLDNTLLLPVLKSGTHSIAVSYLQDMGRWSTPQTVLVVRVQKPWYYSMLMLVVYLLVLLSGVWMLMFYLRRKMLRELSEKMSGTDSLFTGKFEAYVAAHLGENDLSVDQIASELAMSRATLYSKVKAAYGCGIGEYIEAQRMGRARDLLSAGRLSVAEIAESVGYATPRYFSMRFKKAVGVSPLSYRKKRR